MCKVLCFGHYLSNLLFCGWLTALLRENIGWIETLKLCRNLCSFEWLKLNLIKRVSSLRSDILFIAQAEFFFGLIKLRVTFLNFFCRFYFFFGTVQKVRTFKSVCLCPKLLYIVNWFRSGLVVWIIIRLRISCRYSGQKHLTILWKKNNKQDYLLSFKDSRPSSW